MSIRRGSDHEICLRCDTCMRNYVPVHVGPLVHLCLWECGKVNLWKDMQTTHSGQNNLQKRPNNIVQIRSEEHTSELQSLMRISYAVFCLKKKKKNTTKT